MQPHPPALHPFFKQVASPRYATCNVCPGGGRGQPCCASTLTRQCHSVTTWCSTRAATQDRPNTAQHVGQEHRAHSCSSMACRHSANPRMESTNVTTQLTQPTSKPRSPSLMWCTDLLARSGVAVAGRSSAASLLRIGADAAPARPGAKQGRVRGPAAPMLAATAAHLSAPRHVRPRPRHWSHPLHCSWPCAVGGCCRSAAASIAAQGRPGGSAGRPARTQHHQGSTAAHVWQ